MLAIQNYSNYGYNQTSFTGVKSQSAKKAQKAVESTVEETVSNSKFGAFVKEKATKVADFAKKVWSKTVDFAKKVWAKAVEVSKKIWDGIKEKTAKVHKKADVAATRVKGPVTIIEEAATKA